MAKILFIEDDQDQVILYQDKFEKVGHEFITTPDGEKGLELVKKVKPDIILIDVVLEGMGGLEVLEKLKQDPETKDIPALIMSNLEKKEFAEKAMSLGSLDYIVKSRMSLKDTLSKVESYLKQHQSG